MPRMADLAALPPLARSHPNPQPRPLTHTGVHNAIPPRQPAAGSQNLIGPHAHTRCGSWPADLSLPSPTPPQIPPPPPRDPRPRRPTPLKTTTHPSHILRPVSAVRPHGTHCYVEHDGEPRQGGGKGAAACAPFGAGALLPAAAAAPAAPPPQRRRAASSPCRRRARLPHRRGLRWRCGRRCDLHRRGAAASRQGGRPAGAARRQARTAAMSAPPGGASARPGAHTKKHTLASVHSIESLRSFRRGTKSGAAEWGAPTLRSRATPLIPARPRHPTPLARRVCRPRLRAWASKRRIINTHQQHAPQAVIEALQLLGHLDRISVGTPTTCCSRLLATRPGAARRAAAAAGFMLWLLLPQIRRQQQQLHPACYTQCTPDRTIRQGAGALYESMCACLHRGGWAAGVRVRPAEVFVHACHAALRRIMLVKFGSCPHMGMTPCLSLRR